MSLRNPNCTLCPLHESADYICMMGNGPKHAELMIVGEAPGLREEEEGKPFVGPAGQLLNEMLTTAGIKREECFVTNVAKCRPPRNRTPVRAEIKACVGAYLTREIQSVAPRAILALGNTGLLGVLGKSGITKHRGTPLRLGDITVLPTFHPAAVLRTPSLRADVDADLSRLARILNGGAGAPQTRIALVSTPTSLKRLLTLLRSVPAFAYDIETHTEVGGADEMNRNLQDYWGERSRIVSLALAWKEGAAVFIPLHHEQTPWRNPDKVLAALRPALESKGKRVAHNGKFDARWLASKGISVGQTFDTMLAAHMLDENRSKGLKNLSQQLLGADAYELGEDLAEAHKVPLRDLATYNGKDADYTLRLYRIFRRQLVDEPRLARVFAKLVMPASEALVDVERTGLLLDKSRWRNRFKRCGNDEYKLRQFMLKRMPVADRAAFNFGSPQQVATWLFDGMGLPVEIRTPTGKPSTDKRVLRALARDHNEVKALLRWRRVTKLRSTYLLPWKEFVGPDNRLHPVYKLFGTVTHRLSCEAPNIQNVLRGPFMRSVIAAPPDHVLLEADFSQIELRIAAMLANERAMLRQFASGADIHLARAASITGKHPRDVTKEERARAKPVNFAFLYAQGAAGFVNYALDAFDVDYTLKEAQQVREGYFRDYPALRPWHARQRRLAHRYQRVASPIGRVRHLPDVLSPEEDVSAEAERQAINFPVQSFASDLMLLALVELHRTLDPAEARIVASVHDSLLFEVKESALDRWAPIIRETMLNPPLKRLFDVELTVPLAVDMTAGNYWGEGEEITQCPVARHMRSQHPDFPPSKDDKL